MLAGKYGSDTLSGGGGADDLRGGWNDNFIFFDADDTVVRGGPGWDKAFVVGSEAMNADLTLIQINFLTGGAGNDRLRAGASVETEFRAGADGADLVHGSDGAAEGVRAVWGGAGADRFQFVSPAGDANQTWQSSAGILAVYVAGLTALNFAAVTLDMLGLGGNDLSKLAAIVPNPDASDRCLVDGVRINAATLLADPNLQPDDGGTVFGVRPTDWLGATRDVQAVFEDRMLATPAPDVDFFELGEAGDDLSIVVNGQTVEEGNRGVVWGGEGTADLLMILEGSQDQIDNFDVTPYWLKSADLQPYGPFFVAGGGFNDSALSYGGRFATTAPPDAILADWLNLWLNLWLTARHQRTGVAARGRSAKAIAGPRPSPCGPRRYVPSLDLKNRPADWTPDA